MKRFNHILTIKWPLLTSFLLVIFMFTSASCTKKKVAKPVDTRVFVPHPNANHIYQVHIIKMEKEENFPFALPDPNVLGDKLKAKITNHIVKSKKDLEELFSNLNGQPVDLLIGTQNVVRSTFEELGLPPVKNRRTFFLINTSGKFNIQNYHPIIYRPEEVSDFTELVCAKLDCGAQWYKDNKFKVPTTKKPKIEVISDINAEASADALSFAIDWQELLSSCLNATQLQKFELSIKSGTIKVKYPAIHKDIIDPLVLKIMR